MGKGKNQKNVGDTQYGFGKQQQGDWTKAVNQQNSIIGQELATAPGQMSPYAAANYGSEVENIGNTYNNLRMAADKAVGARGFGNAPSGYAASANNTINNAQGNALTGAFRSGLAETQGERDQAQAALSRLTDQTNPNAAYGGATSSYNAADQARANEFKTIIGGVEGAAEMAIPGAQGLGAMSSMMKGSTAAMNNPLPLGNFNGPSLTPSPTGGFGALGKYANSGPSSYGSAWG